MKIVPVILMCILFFVSGTICAQRKQSDREFAGLRGPVKSVLTERTDAKLKDGHLVESNRRKHGYTTFRRDGTSATNTHFHWQTGEAFETNNYSQLEGDKVSKTEMGSGVITATITEHPSRTSPVNPGKSSYDYKFKYKFDDSGRIIEAAWWQHDGPLWMRYVYEYAPGERRELVYAKDGSLNQRYIYKLDPKGNETEMIAYDTDSDRISGKEKYEYLNFDQAGNWTKRVEYESEGGKPSEFKLREVKYRTLTYY